MMQPENTEGLAGYLEMPAPAPQPSIEENPAGPRLFAVMLVEQKKFYGPFYDKLTAELFAGFLTWAVDPAITVPLHEPMDEMLAYFAYKQQEGLRGTTAGQQ